jgi:hypothetical protein
MARTRYLTPEEGGTRDQETKGPRDQGTTHDCMIALLHDKLTSRQADLLEIMPSAPLPIPLPPRTRPRISESGGYVIVRRSLGPSGGIQRLECHREDGESWPGTPFFSGVSWACLGRGQGKQAMDLTPLSVSAFAHLATYPSFALYTIHKHP